MILKLFFNFIFCVVVSSACDKIDIRNIIYYNDGDILEMHIVMDSIPSRFTGYQLIEYCGPVRNAFTRYFELADTNGNLYTKRQEVHPKAILLDANTNHRVYFINLIKIDKGLESDHQMKTVVEIHRNETSFKKPYKKVKRIINYSLTWEPFCAEYKHEEVTILSESSKEDTVNLGEVYEQSCDAGGIHYKEMKHLINNEIIWKWPDGEPQSEPVRYRFKVHSFDHQSKLLCLTDNGARVIPLIYKGLKVENLQQSSRDSEYIFKEGEIKNFICQPKDNSSTVHWILLDRNHIVKNVSKKSNNLSTQRITLTNDEYDGAKLMCLQYSCRYSKTMFENNTMECTREVRIKTTFRRSSEETNSNTEKTVIEPEIIDKETTTRLATTIQLETTTRLETTIQSETTTQPTKTTLSITTSTVAESKDTSVQSSTIYSGIIIGAIVAVLILLVLATLLYCKVKKRRKIEDTSPQEELIYATSEIQYAELEHLQTTNTQPPKREEVLYSKIAGVLIPRVN